VLFELFYKYSFCFKKASNEYLDCVGYTGMRVGVLGGAEASGPLYPPRIIDERSFRLLLFVCLFLKTLFDIIVLGLFAIVFEFLKALCDEIVF
jgi:hypothetical protein